MGTPRSSEISGVIFSLGRRPPFPGLAPWESLISIILMEGLAQSFLSFSSLSEASSFLTPNLAVPIWKMRSPPSAMWCLGIPPSPVLIGMPAMRAPLVRARTAFWPSAP